MEHYGKEMRNPNALRSKKNVFLGKLNVMNFGKLASWRRSCAVGLGTYSCHLYFGYQLVLSDLGCSDK